MNGLFFLLSLSLGHTAAQAQPSTPKFDEIRAVQAKIKSKLQEDVFNFPAPKSLPRQKAMRMWGTYYYVHQANEVATQSQGTTQLLDVQGRAISGHLTLPDFCLGAVEGSIEVRTLGGQVVLYNYHSKAQSLQQDCRPHIPQQGDWTNLVGKTRFRLAFGPFGDGQFENDQKGNILVPFRSVAVDPKTIGLGSVLYIPRARGLKFISFDGKEHSHDGYFYAADVGYGLKPNQIDFFGGVGNRNPLPKLISSDETGSFDILVIESTSIQQSLGALHRFPP